MSGRLAPRAEEIADLPHVSPTIDRTPTPVSHFTIDDGAGAP